MEAKRIITYNINGIRAALKKGFLDFLSKEDYDIICLQEVKALESDLDLSLFEELGYHVYWFSAEKKGYSGVAVLSKQKADEVVKGFGKKDHDSEGRVIRLDWGEFSLFNIYFPSGSSGDLRQEVKYQFLDDIQKHLIEVKESGRKIMVVGDFNICHKEIDIHDPVRNANSSGFLADERAWMDNYFAAGFIDCFRHFNTNPDRYSWWSYRANARANNKGWRIDYITTTEDMLASLIESDILDQLKFSDHCPVYLKFYL